MVEILMVAKDSVSLDRFADALTHARCLVHRVASGGEALQSVTSKTYSALVADETLADMTGIELAKKTVKTNPMVNLILISQLPPDVFHETTEGLGVLCQLPPDPGNEDARSMLTRLKEIL